MMKKYLYLSLIIFVFIFSSCSNQSQHNDNETITIQGRTPYAIFNEMSMTVTDNNKLLLPIKSIRVLDSTTEVNFSTEKIEDGTKDKSMFKYKDLSKYSVVKYAFKSNHLNKTYGYPLTMDCQATFEITLYKNEVQNKTLDKLKNYTYCMQHDKDTLFFVIDVYNGGFENFFNPNTSDIKDINQLHNVRAMALAKQYDANLQEFVKKPEFIKVANEIKGTFKSNSIYDKSYSIYTWIIKNIEFDRSLDPNTSYAGNVNENTPSAYTALTTGKTNCMGYAFLFDALCRYNQMATNILEGQGGSDDDAAPHYWNAVVDGNKAILVDCTFGTGEPGANFVYAPNEAFANCHQVWNNDQKGFFPMLEVNIQ